MSGILKGWEEREIQEQVAERIDGPRERYWLKKLTEWNRWPALFVCGANHSDRFMGLLRKENLEAVLVARDRPDQVADR